jgi:hypothetical protein
MLYVLAVNKLTTIKTIDEIKITNQNLLNTIIYNFCKCKYLTAKFTKVFSKGKNEKSITYTKGILM